MNQSSLSTVQTLCAFGTIAILTTPTIAEAGSFGLYGKTGLHEGKAYYYRSDGKQGVDSQFRPNVGTGFEMMLGDKDDRLIGLLRIAWNHDWSLQNPTYTVTNDEDGNPYTYTHPDYESVSPRDDGLITVGLQWGVWGEPTGFQVTALTALTSGFWTVDNLEYFSPEVGAGVTYTIADQIQFSWNIDGGPTIPQTTVLGCQ